MNTPGEVSPGVVFIRGEVLYLAHVRSGKIREYRGKDMNFGERAAARRKSKELKNELKELRKVMIGAGEDKAQVAAKLKELQDVLELADSLQSDYEKAALHLNRARQAITILLACMGESPQSEVWTSMRALLEDLEQVYHDCSIREDDMDFQSTIRCLKQMTEDVAKQGTDGMQAIMLRSELENVGAVLDDAAGWKAPDFPALAYYFLHEDKNTLKEMENEQRNQYVLSYWNEQYFDSFAQQCERAGVFERMQGVMDDFLSDS